MNEKTHSQNNQLVETPRWWRPLSEQKKMVERFLAKYAKKGDEYPKGFDPSDIPNLPDGMKEEVKGRKEYPMYMVILSPEVLKKHFPKTDKYGSVTHYTTSELYFSNGEYWNKLAQRRVEQVKKRFKYDMPDGDRPLKKPSDVSLYCKDFDSIKRFTPGIHIVMADPFAFEHVTLEEAQKRVSGGKTHIATLEIYAMFALFPELMHPNNIYRYQDSLPTVRYIT